MYVKLLEREGEREKERMRIIQAYAFFVNFLQALTVKASRTN